MEIFVPVFNQMLTMFLLMGLGFFLRKKKYIPENTGSALSKLMVFLISPANILNNQLEKCNAKSFVENAHLVIYGGVLIIIAVLLSYPLSKLFVPEKTGDAKENYQRCVYKYAIAMANFGFAGNYIVQNLWGEDAFFKYTLFTFVFTALSFAWGLNILIPKDKNSSIWVVMKKGLLTPPMIALCLGALGGIFGVKQYLPAFVLTAVSNTAKCYGPTGMLIAGIVIGGYTFKDMIGNKKVYIMAFLRLILIPAVFVTSLKLLDNSGILNVGEDIIKFALLAFCVPSGLNSIVYPATYGGDTKTGSGLVLITNIFSVITLPLMFTLFLSVWK